MCLLGPDGEEGHQVEQRIAGADHPGEPGLAEPERAEKFVLLLGIGEMRQFGLDRRRNHHRRSALPGRVLGDAPAQIVA